jgi:hypothetical protein
MNTENEQFVQVWDYILDNEELDVTDVLLLSKVISLHKTKDGCYMTNEYVCKMLRLKNIPTASRRISKLQKLGYIELRHIPLPGNNKKTRRFIIPTYENGLVQKSKRVDSKVNPPLTLKSIPLDFEVNPPLILKSTPPCLESQSIISVDNINEKISLEDQCNNITENPVEIDLENSASTEKNNLKNLICRKLNLTTKQFFEHIEKRFENYSNKLVLEENKQLVEDYFK